jgi:small subunit ribosomal protein S20
VPHHKSAKKRLKTAQLRNERNRQNRSAMRTAVKAFRSQQGTAEEKAQALVGMYSMLDSQARKGVIPKKRASRLKSRLAALVRD